MTATPMRAQAQAANRRGAMHAAAARKGLRGWNTRLRAAYHNRTAQAVGSALLCGLAGLLIALAGAW